MVKQLACNKTAHHCPSSSSSSSSSSSFWVNSTSLYISGVAVLNCRERLFGQKREASGDRGKELQAGLMCVQLQIALYCTDIAHIAIYCTDIAQIALYCTDYIAMYCTGNPTLH